MKTLDTVKALIAFMAAPAELLGALLDKDASERVKGALMVILVAMGGWFANDYFASNLTKGDIQSIVATQTVQQRLLESQLRDTCREDNTASECERLINDRVDNIRAQVYDDMDISGGS